MEKQFLGGKIVHLVSVEMIIGGLFECCFALRDHLKGGFQTSFLWKAVLVKAAHCQPKIFQLGAGVQILPQRIGWALWSEYLFQLVFLPQKTHFEREKIFVRNLPQEGKWSRGVFCVRRTHAVPRPVGLTLCDALSLFSWFQIYLGLAGVEGGWGLVSAPALNKPHYLVR